MNFKLKELSGHTIIFVDSYGDKYRQTKRDYFYETGLSKDEAYTKANFKNNEDGPYQRYVYKVIDDVNYTPNSDYLGNIDRSWYDV